MGTEAGADRDGGAASDRDKGIEVDGGGASGAERCGLDFREVFGFRERGNSHGKRPHGNAQGGPQGNQQGEKNEIPGNKCWEEAGMGRRADNGETFADDGAAIGKNEEKAGTDGELMTGADGEDTAGADGGFLTGADGENASRVDDEETVGRELSLSEKRVAKTFPFILTCNSSLGNFQFMRKCFFFFFFKYGTKTRR